jgi:hypothetical protein
MRPFTPPTPSTSVLLRLKLPGQSFGVALPGDLRDNGVAVEAQERHSGGQDAGSLILGFVEQLSRGGSLPRDAGLLPPDGVW